MVQINSHATEVRFYNTKVSISFTISGLKKNLRQPGGQTRQRDHQGAIDNAHQHKGRHFPKSPVRTDLDDTCRGVHPDTNRWCQHTDPSKPREHHKQMEQTEIE